MYLRLNHFWNMLTMMWHIKKLLSSAKFNLTINFITMNSIVD